MVKLKEHHIYGIRAEICEALYEEIAQKPNIWKLYLYRFTHKKLLIGPGEAREVQDRMVLSGDIGYVQDAVLSVCAC
jgi:hypothetical protein